jgi:hypothetical protein
MINPLCLRITHSASGGFTIGSVSISWVDISRRSQRWRFTRAASWSSLPVARTLSKYGILCKVTLQLLSSSLSLLSSSFRGAGRIAFTRRLKAPPALDGLITAAVPSPTSLQWQHPHGEHYLIVTEKRIEVLPPSLCLSSSQSPHS